MAKIYNISFQETCCAGFSSSNDASLAPRKIVTSRVVSSGPASAMMPAAASDVVPRPSTGWTKYQILVPSDDLKVVFS